MVAPPDACLEIKAERRFISAINAFAEGFLAAVPSVASRGDVLFALQLVISEACTNVVRHAYPDDETGTVRLEIWVGDREITIHVIDHGKGFDPVESACPNPADLHEGGYGLFLMKQNVDQFEYQRGTEGNVLRCVKRL